MQRRALETAIRDNLVSASLQDSIEQVLEQLQAQIVEYAFEELPDRSSISDLLSTAALSEEKQRTFLQSYLQHDGEIEEFWQGLRQDAEFGDKTVEALQFTLQLGALTQNHLPLVKVLQQQQQAGDLQSLHDLAKLERADWEALIRQEVDGSMVGVPPTIPGADDEEKIANYAQTMTRIIEDAFPTAVIAHRIQGDDFSHAESVSAFLAANPDFEFRTMQIDRYLAEHDVEVKTEVKERLQAMQRLFNIAPRYEKYNSIRSLMADELTSALATRQMGETAFKSVSEKLAKQGH